MISARSIPRVKELDGLRGIMHFAASPLNAFTQAHEKHGDLAQFTQLGRTYYLVFDPARIETVLQLRSHVIKDYFTRDLGVVLGEGLLNAEGEAWKRNRKLMAGTFQPREISGFARSMVACTDAIVAGFRDGDVRDLHNDSMRLTLDVVVDTLFDTKLSRFDDVEHALSEISLEYQRLWQTWRIMLPAWVPVEPRRRIKRARALLDEVLLELIRQKREKPGRDLLSHLIALQDEDGRGLTDAQLRDEAMTLFLAGHETTALALTYVFHLLATHPELYAKLLAEVDSVLGDRMPTHEDAAKLPFTSAVIREGLRLYPPAWTMAREATSDVDAGDLRIPAGVNVIMCQYVVQRDARWFHEPNRFRPERWLGDECSELPRFAYYPFGGGPRVCIGQHFALLELVLVVARMTQSVRFERDAGASFQLSPVITLRPGAPVHFTVRRRTPPQKRESGRAAE
jgi:cytochrome P450